MSGRQPIPDTALEADIAILGKKGRGKTYVAKGLVERLLTLGRRVVVLDPLSTWWGLKAGSNGFAIPVMGGPHADLPLRDVDGKALGRYLAEADISAVLDLGAMRKAELVRFATPFLEELYTFNRRPLTLVLEEADVFAPQQPMNDTARLLGEVDRIARRGRQYGFRLMSLTQRPAKLAKDVLTQLSTLIVLGITAPQDRDAIGAWVEGNADRDAAKSVIGSLASLKVGEGWVWAPDIDLLERVKFPPIRTPDTSATPKAGDAPIAVPARTDINLAALRAALAPAEIVEAQAPQRAGHDGESSRAANEKLAEAERRAYQKGYAEGREDGCRVAISALRDAAASFLAKAERLTEAPAPPPALQAASPSQQQVPRVRAPDPTLKGCPTSPPLPASLPPARQRVLDRLAWFAALGLSPVERARVCVMVGLSPKASTFGVYVSELVREGLVEAIQPGMLRLTKIGAQHAAEPDIGLGPEALVRAAREQLEPQPQRIFDALADAYPGAVRRDDLADALGLSRTASTLGVYLSKLSARGFVENAGRGKVRAAAFLFSSAAQR